MIVPVNVAFPVVNVSVSVSPVTLIPVPVVASFSLLLLNNFATLEVAVKYLLPPTSCISIPEPLI